MKKIQIRGNNYCYEVRNRAKKDTVLLVHGHPFNHSMWKYQYETLNQYRLILPDLIGYGRSDFNFERIFIEEQALDLALLLDELGIDKVHLIGLSMGGQIIVEFCRLFPQKTASLIICASIPNSETESSYNIRLELANEISKIGMVQHITETIHKYINIENNDQGSEVYKHLYHMMSTTPSQGAIASHKGRAKRRNNMSYLKKIKKPTMVIAAEKDYFFKVDDIKAVADGIANSSFHIVPDSGHLPNMENSELFNALLLDFYKRL